MADDELERRIEILEGDVEALTEALRSVLDWQYVVAQTRNFPPPPRVKVSGTDRTREILERLP